MGDPFCDFNDACLDFMETLASITDDSEKRNRVRRHLEYLVENRRGTVVPDFRPGLEWLNVTEPLSLRRHLEGKIVLLDFFTYCCINCMHILPDLKLLEKEFPIEDGLVVIGVHSAKFTNEKSTANVESAIRRYEVTHPVVNDTAQGMWNSLGICCWPTLYIMGPGLEPLLSIQGEGNFDFLKMFISEAIEVFGTRGGLSSRPLPQVSPFQKSTLSSILAYPGKININKSGTVVGVSDTANHRVLVLSLDGDLSHEIGGLDSGLADGNFATARFSSPQGLAFHKDVIFVADTENHCIREINLTTKLVTTIVGNGKQGADHKGGSDGVAQSISSPWDVCVVNNILFIAMAGIHQIWAYFLEDTTLWKKNHKKGTCAAVVGSGREENRNNHYPMNCGLAQPSGLTYNNAGLLFVADSESSTIRMVNVETGVVAPLVGGSRNPENLFAFGDVDGTGIEAKLQHPLGVTWSPYDGCVYVADSYNHKIKKINKDTKQCMTVGDYSKYKLNEPGGLCALGDKLLIADTNNHCIKIMSLPSNTFTTLDINFEEGGRDDADTGNKEEKFGMKLNTAGGVLRLSMGLTLPEQVTLTPDAPSKWIVSLPGNRMLPADKTFTTAPKWDITINRRDFESPDDQVRVTCRLFYCSEGKCYVKEVKFSVNVEFCDEAPSTADVVIQHNLSLDT